MTVSEPSTWTDPDVIVQAGAGLAAIVAAIVVIVQTILTRKALEEAAKSRATAEAALAVARSEHRNSTFLAIEAVRSRIALNAPSAKLHVDEIIDAIYSPSITGSGYAERWPHDYVFHIGDSQRLLMVRAAVTLRNTGPRATRFTLHRAIRHGVWRAEETGRSYLAGTDVGPEDVLLEAGEAFTGYWEVTRPMHEWIEIFEVRSTGEGPGPEAVLEAYVDDGHDTGASYAYRVLLGGAALKPERPSVRETWVFAGLWNPAVNPDVGVGSGSQPTTVTAWLSKRESVPLPAAVPAVDQPES